MIIFKSFWNNSLKNLNPCADLLDCDSEYPLEGDILHLMVFLWDLYSSAWMSERKPEQPRYKNHMVEYKHKDSIYGVYIKIVYWR